MAFLRSREGGTPLEHTGTQCLSEDAWMRGILAVATSLPALPARETRLDFLRHYADCSAERLGALESMPQEWFEQDVTFFDVVRSRAWALVRRMTHSAHHRGVDDLTCAMGGASLSTYGPTADTGGLAKDPAPG